MRKTTLAILAAAILLAPAWAFAAEASSTADNAKLMRARPAALTTSQFAALRQLETTPAHNHVLSMSASYASERERNMAWTRASDDFLTIVYDVGWPGTYLAVLICAM